MWVTYFSFCEYFHKGNKNIDTRFPATWWRHGKESWNLFDAQISERSRSHSSDHPGSRNACACALSRNSLSFPTRRQSAGLRSGLCGKIKKNKHKTFSEDVCIIFGEFSLHHGKMLHIHTVQVALLIGVKNTWMKNN